MTKYFSKQQFFASTVAVLLSVLTVAVVAYGASIIDTASVGSGTTTPGAALGVKGAIIAEDFVWGNAFIGTSTSQASGLGTTSPGAEFAVSGGGLFEGGLTVSFLRATSSVISSVGSNFGAGTSTPGAGLGVKGAAIIEDFVHAGAFRSTSTDTSWIMGGSFGLGTTTPGAKLAVRGSGLFDGTVSASSIVATSTTATSTLRYGMQIATTTTVDGQSGRWVIGSSTIPDADVAATTQSADPGLTISGVGSTANATGTLYITGGSDGGGGQIILRSVDGTRCIAVSASSAGGALETGVSLTAEIVACPR